MNDFPIPYQNNQACDDLAEAVLMLNLVGDGLEAGKEIDSHAQQCLHAVLHAALEKIAPIQVFLDDLDFLGITKTYADARRVWIRQKGGAK